MIDDLKELLEAGVVYNNLVLNDSAASKGDTEDWVEKRDIHCGWAGN